MPAETAALITDDGWLRTGDGGYLDEQGHLFLTDRVKDLIISGGENVYPAEVETVQRRHPDVAVFGLPDDRWGEVVAAAVVLRAPGPSAADLVAFTEGRLAGYKRPRTIRFVDELPRNAAGKVLRRVLRDGALEGSST
jgi:acyl-CoA synthetase (AMP-forming)/AMP-acid ligase II